MKLPHEVEDTYLYVMLIIIYSVNNDISRINYFKIIVYSIIIILPVNRNNIGKVIRTRQNTLQ